MEAFQTILSRIHTKAENEPDGLQEFLEDSWTGFKDRLDSKNGRDLTLSFYVIFSLKQLWWKIRKLKSYSV